MVFETTIYGEVEVPIAEDGLSDFIAIREKLPGLRVEVQRGDLRFLLPLRCVLVDDRHAGTERPLKIHVRRIGHAVRFG